jgi:hypothetical protein
MRAARVSHLAVLGEDVRLLGLLARRDLPPVGGDRVPRLSGGRPAGREPGRRPGVARDDGPRDAAFKPRLRMRPKLMQG